MRRINAIAKELLRWYPKNARDLPWRRTHDPYAIWVSEIMLQQTQVKTVIPFWERWLRELPTIAAAANASSGKLHKLWEGLGYYTRVRNLQKAAQEIVQRHGGRFPERFADVLALPGIGRYTAGAVCSIAFNQPKPILDGNVIRVLTRLFGIAENPREKATNTRLWTLAEALVVYASRSADHAGKSGTRTRDLRHGCSQLNQSLMELGALVCTPRHAQCPLCPVRRLCVAFRENRVEALPNLGRKEPTAARRFAAFVLERGGKFLVRQRPAGVVNAHLWEFPNVELESRNSGPRAAVARTALPGVTGAHTGTAAEAAEQLPGLAARDLSPLVTVRHSITRYRITVEAFRVRLGGANLPQNGAQWKSPAQMRQLAFTSAHRRILRAAVARAAAPPITAGHDRAGRMRVNPSP